MDDSQVVLVDEERKPIGQCNKIDANRSYALVSCDLNNPNVPLIRRAIVNFYSDSDDCSTTAIGLDLISGTCEDDVPVAGQSLSIKCSLGSMVHASLMMLLLAFFLMF